MYKLKDGIDRDIVRRYGFRKGKEYPEYQEVICNKPEYEDYWLLPLDPDEEEEKLCRDDNQTLWSIHIQSSGRIWIDGVPFSTYHIDNSDMELAFYTLRSMILDGLIDDDMDESLQSEN